MRNVSIVAIVVGFFCTTFFLSSCSYLNETDGGTFITTGTITRPDFRQCVCCGGWFIEIDKEEYRFFTLPKGSDIALPLNIEDLPINVRLTWSKSGSGMSCGDDLIVIEKIERE